MQNKAYAFPHFERLSKARDTTPFSLASRPFEVSFMETDQKICPCCRLPTLSERGNYEICMVCWWEDNGQDDHNADEVQGGPNQLYSLSEARENYAHHGHMYANGEGISELENPTQARRGLLAYIGTKTDTCQQIDSEKFEFLLDRASKPTNR